MLESQFAQCFDFRDPTQKRMEFDKQKTRLMTQLTEHYGRMCMLDYPNICEGSKTLVLDHFIPLSSNVLNKTLRHLPRLGVKKVLTQSFGSNHPDNLILSCPRCNAFKKHNMPTAELVTKIRAIKTQ